MGLLWVLHKSGPLLPPCSVTSVWPCFVPCSPSTFQDSVKSFPFPTGPDALGVPAGTPVKASKGKTSGSQSGCTRSHLESWEGIPVPRLCPDQLSDLGVWDIDINIFFKFPR